MYLADAPSWFPIVMLVIYLVLSARGAAKKRRKLKEQKQKSEQQVGDTEVMREKPGKPKSFDEVLAEMFREVETKTKPFAKPETLKEIRKQESFKGKYTRAPLPPLPKKKEVKPFLPFDFQEGEDSKLGATQETTILDTMGPEGASLHLKDPTGDVFKASEIYGFDYSIKEPVKKKSRINLRDAVIGQIVLQRPQW